MKTTTSVGVGCLVFLAVFAALPAMAQNWAEAPGSPYAVASYPESMAVTPSGTYLYVLNSVSSAPNSISAFRVNSDAALTEVSGSPFSADENAVDIASDGRFVFTANGIGSDTIGVFAIGASGGLTQVSGSPFPSGGNASQNLEVTPSGEFLVVTNAASDNFGVFSINGTSGALTAVPGSPFSAGDEPQGLVIDSTSTRLIISNCLGDSFSVYDVNPSTGGLAEVSGSPFTGPDCPDGLVLNEAGTFLFVDGLNSFNGYAVAANGSLTELSGSPYPAIGYSYEQGIALSWDGTYVFTTGEASATGDDSLVVFRIQPDGNLERASFSPVPLVRETFEVVAHPRRDIVFLADSVDDSVTVVEELLLSGSGTSTIDGVKTTGEWDAADVAEFQVNLIGGGTTDGTLYVMNDETNLYLAVEFDSAGSATQGGVTFQFDNDVNGECDDGDDLLGASDYGLTDAFWSSGCSVGDFDTSDGGTTDGQVAGDGSMTYLEISHPLDSGDTGHDFELGPGSTVGFLLGIRFCDDATCVDTDFPHTNLPYAAHILVDGGGIFADDFESGDTLAWSHRVP